MKRVRDRLKMFESVSKTEASQAKRRGLKQETQAMVQRMLAEQQAKYDSGGMGYGPGMHQLHVDPWRNRKARRVDAGGRMWRSLRLKELPTISLDMKFCPEDTIHVQHRLGMQVTEMVSHNLHELRYPFPMQFVNFDRNVLCEEVCKVICPYGPYAHQLITPDELVDNPLEANRIDAVYISRFSNNVLDGPLTNFSNVILPVTDDTHRQSLGTFQRMGFHHAKLPIQTYLRPEHRPLKVKLVDVLKIFAEVCQNGGDWNTALHTILLG
ncbi:Protein C56G2.3 [Aphelenchoides avenae]|nr:Protein C56G2.3 [Aphelenchus avenae]